MSAWKSKVPAAGGGGEQRPLPEEGNNPAVLVGLIDLGTKSEQFGDQEPKDTHKVLLVWELAGQTDPATGLALTIGRDYTYSFNEKAHLRNLIESWRSKPLSEGEEFDLTKLLGQPCLVNIAHKTSQKTNRSYAIVKSVSGWSGPLVKSMTKPAATIEPVSWSFEDGDYPEWGWVPYLYGKPVQEALLECKEMKAARNGDAREPVGASADSAPF